MLTTYKQQIEAIAKAQRLLKDASNGRGVWAMPPGEWTAQDKLALNDAGNTVNAMRLESYVQRAKDIKTKKGG